MYLAKKKRWLWDTNIQFFSILFAHKVSPHTSFYIILFDLPSRMGTQSIRQLLTNFYLVFLSPTYFHKNPTKCILDYHPECFRKFRIFFLRRFVICLCKQAWWLLERFYFGKRHLVKICVFISNLVQPRILYFDRKNLVNF